MYISIKIFYVDFLVSKMAAVVFSVNSLSFSFPWLTTWSIVASFSRKIGRMMDLEDKVDHSLVVADILKGLLVDNDRSIKGWHAPNQESTFAQPIKWQPPNNEIGKRLQNGESGKNDPVNEPLGVVAFIGRFYEAEEQVLFDFLQAKVSSATKHLAKRKIGLRSQHELLI